MAMDNRLLVPRYKYDPDAARYLAAVEAADGQSLETPVRKAVDAFFRDTKAAGVFDALKACCILAGARTLAGALVPVVGDAPTNVANGFVNGDYSRTAGLKGDGTSYIDSGRANDDDPQNDKHISVYATARGTGTNAYAGGYVTSPTLTVSQLWTNNPAALIYAAINDGTGITKSMTAAGFIGTTRSGSTVSIRAGSATESATVATIGHPSFNIYVFARNVGSPDGVSNATIAFYSIGTSLSLEDLDTAVSNLITAIGNAL